MPGAKWCLKGSWDLMRPYRRCLCLSSPRICSCTLVPHTVQGRRAMRGPLRLQPLTLSSLQLNFGRGLSQAVEVMWRAVPCVSLCL